MAANPSTLHGVVHGKTIELDKETGLQDGQSVIVDVQPVSSAEPRSGPGNGIRRSAGGWSDDPDGLIEFLQWSRQQRKVGRAAISE